MRFCTITFYLVFLFVSSNSNGQVNQNQLEKYSLPHSEQRFLSSEVNGIDYKIYISYPQSYKDSVGRNIQYCTCWMRIIPLQLLKISLTIYQKEIIYGR